MIGNSRHPPFPKHDFYLLTCYLFHPSQSISNNVDQFDMSSSTADLGDFKLDILVQHPRINRLYTQLTLGFKLPDNSSATHSRVVHTLTKGVEYASVQVPWLAGHVVQDHGTFIIKRTNVTSILIVKDLIIDESVFNWAILSGANFPFSMLDESLVAPCKTLSHPDAELPVFLLQANFITGGLLLTINAQHGSMDMTGQAEIMRLLAKACRGESFSESELLTVNMDRGNIIPLLNESDLVPEVNKDLRKDSTTQEAKLPQTPSPEVLVWTYFSFSTTTLAILKSIAYKTVPKNSFVSTDDTLSAFVWQSISRARSTRLQDLSKVVSTFSRNVDVRRYLSIPAGYSGMMTSSTVHRITILELLEEQLGGLASKLRSALDPVVLKRKTQVRATNVSRGIKENLSFADTSDPSLDIRLSSWAKEKCYDLEFGFGLGIGKPDVVRRPQFIDGAREGLVYFLPKRLDGEIVVGVCLRRDDLEKLQDDSEFSKYGEWIG
jgi:hypothetical protein